MQPEGRARWPGRVYRERRSFGPAARIFRPESAPVHDLRPHQAHPDHLRLPHPHLRHHPLPAALQICSPPVDPFDGENTRYLARHRLGSNIEDSYNDEGTPRPPPSSQAPSATTHFLTTDFWYSADLQTNLVVLRHDPRFGTQLLHLANLVPPSPIRDSSHPRRFTLKDARTVSAPQLIPPMSRLFPPPESRPPNPSRDLPVRPRKSPPRPRQPIPRRAKTSASRLGSRPRQGRAHPPCRHPPASRLARAPILRRA